jgi:predicted PurR-regulated permease PerM
MSPLNRILISGASIVLIVAGMKAASSILGFVLFAVLLSTWIPPLVTLMARKGVSRNLALTITILVVILGGFLLATVQGSSISRLVQTVPSYESRLAELKDAIMSMFARFDINISDLFSREEFDPQRIIRISTALLGVVLNTISTSLFLFILVSLMLVEVVGFEARIQQDISFGTTLRARLFEVRKEIRKFVSITALTGLVTAIANVILLVILGVDFAVLWGVLSFLLSFIPAIGGILSFIPPALLAFLEFGWTRSITVIVGFVVINNLVDNVLKPKLMTQGLDISILLIFLSLMFWSWVLGPIGAILAIPLTLFVKRFVAEISREDDAGSALLSSSVPDQTASGEGTMQ